MFVITDSAQTSVGEKESAKYNVINTKYKV